MIGRFWELTLSRKLYLNRLGVRSQRLVEILLVSFTRFLAVANQNLVGNNLQLLMTYFLQLRVCQAIFKILKNVLITDTHLNK